MAIVTVQDIVDSAAIQLQDVEHVRWGVTELQRWVIEGQREIVGLRPDAYVRNEGFYLVEGTKQTLQGDSLRLVDIVRNLGTDGNTPGKAISLIDRELLDAQRPNWHADTPSATVRHYVYDDRDPKVFYVSPPQPATNTGIVEAVISVAPPNRDLTDYIVLDDTYSNALTLYVLSCAYRKDAEFTKNQSKSDQYYSAMLRSLGILGAAEQARNPNNNVPPFANQPSERK